MVSRVLLHQIWQDNGEAIRAFAARVKGQATEGSRGNSYSAIGKCGHGFSSRLGQRRKQSAAFGHACKTCNKLNQFESLWRNHYKHLKSSKAVVNDINANANIFISLCMVQSKTSSKLTHVCCSEFGN